MQANQSREGMPGRLSPRPVIGQPRWGGPVFVVSVLSLLFWLLHRMPEFFVLSRLSPLSPLLLFSPLSLPLSSSFIFIASALPSYTYSIIFISCLYF